MEELCLVLIILGSLIIAGSQLHKSLVDVFVTISKEDLQKCIPEQVKY